jgi:hypothetical protein
LYPEAVTADVAKAATFFANAEPALQIESFFRDFDALHAL